MSGTVRGIKRGFCLLRGEERHAQERSTNCKVVRGGALANGDRAEGEVPRERRREEDVHVTGLWARRPVSESGRRVVASAGLGPGASSEG